jgi:futalosine hydrolase
MRVLLVAATSAEIEPIVHRLTGSALSGRQFHFQHHDVAVDVLVTGVGMVATAFWCGKVLSELRPDLALDIGVAGSFSPHYPPGTVVNVVSDCFPDVGAEDGERFLGSDEIGLIAPNQAPFQSGRLENPHRQDVFAHLPRVNGITVNMVHGHEPTIAEVVRRWSPDVESMEGAAFLYACLLEAVPCAQIRAVSNRVERRARENWKMTEALANLALEVSTAVEAL